MFQALQEHQRRIAQRGAKRVEVSALASDADLIRRMARVLDKDDEAAKRLRKVLQRLLPPPPVKFEDWLRQPEEKQRRAISRPVAGMVRSPWPEHMPRGIG
jgi:hypothetical protein